MKITIEIPDFDTWGNNDDTPTTFLEHLKAEIIETVSRKFLKNSNEELERLKRECETKIDLIHKSNLSKADKILEEFQLEAEKTIKNLKTKV